MPLEEPLPRPLSVDTLYLARVSPDEETRARALLGEYDGRMHPARFHGPASVPRHMDALLDDFDLPIRHLPWLCDTIAHRMLSTRPKFAGAVYVRAREAETKHGLARDPHHTVENALLFARHGVLPASEVRDHGLRLAELLEPAKAHREFVRFLEAWAGGSVAADALLHPHDRASVGVPVPADLITRIRASVKPLGLSTREQAVEVSRVLGGHLSSLRYGIVPDGLLEQAKKVFAKAPVAPGHRRGIASLFPTSVTDGGAWLRLLESTGIVEAMVEGEVRPEGGYGAWLSRFHHMYARRWERGAVGCQPLPEELFTLLPRLAPRVRAENAPVRLTEVRYGHIHVNPRLLIACDDLDIPVEAPEGQATAIRQDERRRRTPPPPTPSPATVGRVEDRIERLRTAPLGEAELALAELDVELSHFVMDTLPGLQERLDDLDPAGPLARTLRFGLPAEYTWPAFERAVEEMRARPGGIKAMTSTWPVLTVHGDDAAIAVDHQGRRGMCEFTLPEGTARHTVHYAGGDFLVTLVPAGVHVDHEGAKARAFWCSEPEDVFEVEAPSALFSHGYDLALVLEAPGGGRYEYGRVLRPGDRTGVSYVADQATDGARVWTDGGEWDDGARELDPDTGALLERSSPEFLTPDPRLESVVLPKARPHLVRLPAGVTTSPLGSEDGLAGARVAYYGPAPEEDGDVVLAMESPDGRRAPYSRERDLKYWGVLRLPENPTEGLLAYRAQAGHTVIQCRDTTDDSLAWETWAYPRGGLKNVDLVGRRPLMPPPAFWHFLTPRSPESGRALRDVDEDTARRLIEIALEAPVPEDPTPSVALPEVAARVDRARGAVVRAALPELLPEVTDPDVSEGVVWATLWAAELRLGLRRMSDRVARVRSGSLIRPVGEAADPNMRMALSSLAPQNAFSHGPSDHPTMITSIAADGARLSGRIDETTRRLSPAGVPTPWAYVFGLIDALMWRLALGRGNREERECLIVLLRTWADQPFATRGTTWVEGNATGAALGPSLARGEAVVLETPFDLSVHRQDSVPHWSPRYLPERRYTYLRVGDAPAPEGAEEQEPIRIDRDDAGRLRAFLETFERNGPLTFEPEVIKAFRKQTGVMGPVAEFLLGARRSITDLSKGAQRAYRKTEGELTPDERARLYGAAVPDDPTDLWLPEGRAEAAERLARAWAERFGAPPAR